MDNALLAKLRLETCRKHFKNNKKALETIQSMPFEVFAENDVVALVEMIIEKMRGGEV